MAGNTIMTAKNSFQEGLVMDFAPDNTQANCLTSALNATLLTFNGNEMSLQNDMGNGRVETAYLPEGYVPVGTCEFGDIIYIVSYNPLIDKALIGCFPSPERNISSEELHNPDVALAASDFQELDSDGEPTGELKTSSVKKILFLNDLHPGDKYIVYAQDINLADVIKTLSDYGNTDHTIGKFPKFVKIRIVSIEESGKITYIDSNTKWYNNDYYIQEGTVDGSTLKPDIDSYRSLVSSAYNTFASKVSGKLALLIELEKITGFSHSWEVYEIEKDDETKKDDDNIDNIYNIYFNFSWTTDSVYINPSAVCLTKYLWNDSEDRDVFNYKSFVKNTDGSIETIERSLQAEPPKKNITINRQYEPESTSNFKSVKNLYSSFEIENIKLHYVDHLPDEGSYKNEAGKVLSIKEDDVINNIYNYPITKLFWEGLAIPVRRNGYDVNIDGVIYNYEITPTMPYGYLREFSQKGQIDFSKIGKEHIKLHTWKYYNTSDVCTLTWGMDAYTSPGKVVSKVEFSFYDDKGLVATLTSDNKRSYNGMFTEYFNFNSEGSHPKLKNMERDNDLDKKEKALILSNSLYLVKIDVYQSFKQADGTLQGEDITYTEYRWFWTNGVFNEYYNQVSDFDKLDLVLDLDFDTLFTSNNNWSLIVENLKGDPEKSDINALYESLCINKQTVDSQDNNINMEIIPKLQNNYETFVLETHNLFKAEISFVNKKVTNYPEQPNIIHTSYELSLANELTPISSTDFKTPVVDIWSSKDAYLNYKNSFDLSALTNYSESKTKYYTTSDGEIKEGDLITYTFDSLDIPLLFKANHYSKYHRYIDTVISNHPALRPLLYDKSDLDKYYLINDGGIYFSRACFSSLDNYNDSSGDDAAFSATICDLSGMISNEAGVDVQQVENNLYEQAWKVGQSDHNYYDLTSKFKTQLNEHFSFFVPYCIGFNNSALDDYISAKENFSKRRITQVYLDDEHWVQNEDTQVDDYKTYPGGMLALKDKSGHLLVLDTRKSGGYIHTQTNYIVSLLSNIYALSDELYEYDRKEISNMSYLTSNYTEFSQDIVIELLYLSAPTIKLLSSSLEEYLNLVFDKSKINKNLVNSSNVTLQCNNITKTVPVVFKFTYIKPEQDIIENNLATKILSGSEMPSEISGNFVKGLLYLYDGNEFVNLKNAKNKGVKFVESLSEENGIIKPNYLGVGQCSVNAIYKYLELENGNLILNTSFDKKYPNTDTYGIATCKKQENSNTVYSITGYPEGINFETVL